MKYSGLLVLTLVLLPQVTIAQTTGCWDLGEYSEVVMVYPGAETVSLYVLPDGLGNPFSAAQLPYGAVVDATLTLTLRDCWDVPVADFPFEDLWLESEDGGLVACAGGTVADAGTDANGVTTWSAPLRAGGFSEAGCVVMINGMVLLYGPPLDLRFNSPDLNSDLLVNLSDVAIFVGDFWGPYHYRSDFSCDGVLNLSDVPLMIRGVGAACP